MSEQQFDPKDLRNAFGTFATGVTIVTTKEPSGIPRGFTANSFTSVSLDPPLVLVCIGKFAASLEVFSNSEGFAVNILSEVQKDVAGLFATQRADKFENTVWHEGKGNMPLIDGALSWFECERNKVIDAGDHIILIGEVKDYAYSQGQPLGYVNGGFFTLEGGQSLIEAAGKHNKTNLGAVLANDERILLIEDENGAVLVPNTLYFKLHASPAALGKLLEDKGLVPSHDFLLSAYEDKPSDTFLIYYRGTVSGDAPEGMRYYGFDEIPFDRIYDAAMRFMLRRYIKEQRQGRFAVYHGNEKSGETRQVNQESEASNV